MFAGCIVGVVVGLLLKLNAIKEYLIVQDTLNKEIYKFLEALQKQQLKNTKDVKLLFSGTTATLNELDSFKLQIANTFTELNKYFNGETSQVDLEEPSPETKDKDKLN